MKLALALGVSLLALTTACSVDSAPEVEGAGQSIIGGSEAAAGAYPGTVSIFLGGSHFCGGALVAADWVVTAAHCVIDPEQADGGLTSVIIDRHQLSSTKGEAIAIKRAIPHPRYDEETKDNDIALLQLERPSSAKTVHLGGRTTALAEGDETHVVGWGSIAEGGGGSDVLLDVAVPVISTETCKTFTYYENVGKNQICAGFLEGKKDSCQGDSGGPLFAKVGGELVEVGLVSWGYGCARPNAPGVYTRLGNYLDWIETTSGGAITSP